MSPATSRLLLKSLNAVWVEEKLKKQTKQGLCKNCSSGSTDQPTETVAKPISRFRCTGAVEHHPS